eukprot:scaffold21054_cov38-Phaeocystis_antarctica.AAC.1
MTKHARRHLALASRCHRLARVLAQAPRAHFVLVPTHLAAGVDEPLAEPPAPCMHLICTMHAMRTTCTLHASTLYVQPPAAERLRETELPWARSGHRVQDPPVAPARADELEQAAVARAPPVKPREAFRIRHLGAQCRRRRLVQPGVARAERRRREQQPQHRHRAEAHHLVGVGREHRPEVVAREHLALLPRKPDLHGRKRLPLDEHPQRVGANLQAARLERRRLEPRPVAIRLVGLDVHRHLRPAARDAREAHVRADH